MNETYFTIESRIHSFFKGWVTDLYAQIIFKKFLKKFLKFYVCLKNEKKRKKQNVLVEQRER